MPEHGKEQFQWCRQRVFGAPECPKPMTHRRGQSDGGEQPVGVRQGSFRAPTPHETDPDPAAGAHRRRHQLSPGASSSPLHSFMIPLYSHPTLRRDPDAQSDMNESITSTAADVTAQKPPSTQSAARTRAHKWSRRIMITTESLWLKKIRRNKFKTFVYIFLPSVFIFLLAFSLAPPRGFSNSNNLMFYTGGVMAPDTLFTAGVVPKRIHSRRDCEFSYHRLQLIWRLFELLIIVSLCDSGWQRSRCGTLHYLLR